MIRHSRVALNIMYDDEAEKFILNVSNETRADVVLFTRPTPPKRKIVDRRIVRANSYLVIEDVADISNLCIGFKEVENDTRQSVTTG